MINLIAAYSKNKVIGYKGQIPWKIPGEQYRFKQLTQGNIVVMGRKTFEEIGKPLPNRFNIVISSTKNFSYENCITLKSINQALNMYKDKNIFICGGERLYRETLDIADKLYITQIDADFQGDTFFPDFDENEFYIKREKTVLGKIPYTYFTYTRKIYCSNNFVKS